jgi:hypothetical protein
VGRRSRGGWLAVAMFVGYLGVLAVNRSLVVVRGPSMEPALWPGDRLLTVPARRWWLRPGMVVVVVAPDTGRAAVKRLRDLADGTVEVRGDAPDRSTDSRQFGRLPLRAVRRVAVARWPDLRTPLRRGQAGRWAWTSSSGSSSATSPAERRP